MVIFTSCNDNFIKGLLSLVVSLCKNNPGHHDFYVAYASINDKNKEYILKNTKPFNVTVNFVFIDKNNYFNNDVFKISGRYFWESMIRLLPQIILPSDVKKALYLDVDIVINGSLEKFYNTDISNHSIAAIVAKRDGSGNEYYDMNAGVYNLIKIDLGDDLYFNAGVFLANIDYFRKNITEQTYIDVANKHKEDLVFADQCLMNIVFKDTALKIIDMRYNCCFACYTPIPHKEYKWLKKNVICMHYIANPKPWVCSKYYSKLFFIYVVYLHNYQKCLCFLVFLIMKPFNLLTKKIRSCLLK